MKSFLRILFFLVTVSVFAADRYWVGGTDNWNATAGSKWALTSGGAGGEAVPAAGDDVYLDVGSGAVTVTIATATPVIRSLICTGFTGTLAFDNGTRTIAIGTTTAGPGSPAVAMKLVAGMTFAPAAGNLITFWSTSTTQQEIYFGGKTTGSVTFSGAASSYKYMDGHTALTTATVTLTNGTLDTNGQTCDWGVFVSGGAATRVLTMGASSITIRGGAATVSWNCAASGLTMNADTSTITFVNVSAFTAGGMETGGKSYNNVVFNGAGTPNIYGTGSFVNLTRTGTAVKTDGFGIVSTSFTVTGVFTLAGNSVVNRLIVYSTVLGTARTATVTGATKTFSNVDFRDITFANGGSNLDLSAITGLSGDCGGNSISGGGTLTFTTAATQTSTGTASFSWSTHGWTSRVPLPQDDVIVNNVFVSGRAITTDMPRAGKNIDFSGLTWAGTATNMTGAGNVPTVYGSLTMKAGMTGSINVAFEGRSTTFVLTSAGFTFAGPALSMFGGTLELADALITTGAITINNGTLDAATNNVNVTAGAGVVTSNANTRRIKMGDGTWTLSGTATCWSSTTSTGLTVEQDSSTILITNTGATAKTFSSGTGLTFHNLTITGSSSGSVDFFGSCSFDGVFTVNAPMNVRFTNGTTTNFASFVATGSAGNVITINTVSGTATHALTKTGGGTISCDYLNIQHCVATPSNTWYAGTNSTDNQAVATAGSGWIFTAPPAGGNTSNFFLVF